MTRLGTTQTRFSEASRPVASLPRSGFTLTEVLLVLAILGVIAAMVLPNLIGSQQKAMIKSSVASIKIMEDACKQYAIDHESNFPEGGQDVIQLLTTPTQGTDNKPLPPYLEKTPKDAWGMPLYYAWPNTKSQNAVKPAIWSSGPNKTNDEGGGDDINNWTE